MKTHTSNFKNEIATFGRELDSVITYEFDGETVKLGNEQLNSVSPRYEGAILKSVMKQLDIESTVEIPLETQINYRFGVKVRDDEVQDYRDNYDYIDYGNYIVYKSEKQEDTNSYKITCYDKMLYSMVKYEDMQITYPITIRNYINTICNYLGLIFKNANDTFANYDKEIQNELFLDSEGGDLNYTFRDVLDQLAEVTASTICLDENDQLEIRYINEGEFIPYEILGETTQEEIPTPDNPVPINNKTGKIIHNGKKINLGNIELCKIDDYQDSIRKGTGKNLFDKSNITTGKTYTGTGGTTTLNNSFIQETYIPVSSSTAYTMSTTNNYSSETDYRLVICEYKDDKTFIKRSLGGGNVGNKYTITTTENTKYVRLCASTITLDELQFEQNSTATDYEPYGSKGKWLLTKKIGKVVLDGTESWSKMNWSGKNAYRTKITNLKITTGGNQRGYLRSDRFQLYTTNGLFNLEVPAYGICHRTSQNEIIIRYDGYTSASDFKTWLEDHNTTVYYAMETPVTTEITDSTLINQLENAGKVADTIDEEYLKNININFSEKYGPINSIVLSRSAESDNVYLRDEESVLQDGLCELKIIDNQIMNWNDRSDYLQDILDQLDGLEYYLNDFSSTGVCYYDLCDRYNIQIGEETYSCIMFNDEVNITTGMEENIHTDMPSETQTDYTKADKTDRRINQAYIMVDKQNGNITSLVTKTTQLESRIINDETIIDNNYQEIIGKFDGVASTDDVSQLRQSMQTTMNEQELKIENIQGILVNGVEKVVTTSGTFDENGLTMERTGARTKSTLDETGIDVKDTQGSSNEDLFFAGYVDNDKAQSNTKLAPYEGQTVVFSKNSIVENYFTIGTHSRIEDYEDGTGVFYIGG